MSIKLRLFVLFTLPVLAIVGTRTFELHREHNERLSNAYQRTVGLARSAIDRQEALISEIRTLLQVLSRVPDIADGSSQACRRMLQDVASEKPWLKGIWVVNPDGRAICSTVPGGVGMTFATKHYFRAAMETRAFVIEHYWVGRLRSLPAAVAALPVLDSDGKISKIIMASFDLDWLVSIADEVMQNAGATFLLVDEAGIVLARHPEIESIVERNYSNHPLIKALGDARQGQFEMPDLDGTQRIFGFAKLPGTNARLVIGLSRNIVLAAINSQTWMSVVTLAIVCFLGLLAAWFGGERLILRPVRALAETAAQFGAGNYSVRAPSDGHRSEFGILAATLNEMADQLKARENKLIAKVDKMTLLAEVDPLTGLANRRRFDRVLAAQWKDSLQHGQMLAVLLIDVDFFKRLNDQYGHVVGDRCLQDIGHVLRASIAVNEGLAARFGGEEFAVLLPVGDEHQAMSFAERIRADVQRLDIENAGAVGGVLTVSVGVAVVRGSLFESPLDLVQDADSALYEAKRKGRNMVCSWSDTEAGSRVALPLHVDQPVSLVPSLPESDVSLAVTKNRNVHNK